MSMNCSKICSLLIEETFGTVIQSVSEIMLRRGPSSLRLILSQAKLPIQTVRDSLKTLIQHSLVTFAPKSVENSELYYTIQKDNVLELLRFPKYLIHAEKSAGGVAREILEEVVKAGTLPVSKLIYICGYRVKKSNPDIGPDTLIEQLLLFKSTIQNLAVRKYIILHPGGNTESANQDVINNKELFTVPDVDEHLICDKLMETGDLKLEDLPDANVLWKINVRQFHAEIRNILVYQAIERKFKSMIDPRILQIIIDIGFDKHPWEKDGHPVSASEVADKVVKMEGGTLTAKFIDEHFEIIEEDPKRLVTKLSNNHGGHFSFNMKTAVSELVWSTIDSIITERHGFFALRIFRLIREKSYIEQDQINELGMIPAKEAKHLTYKLVEDQFIRIKEIRKTYNATAPPGKVNHVFHVDIDQVVRSLREFCYKSMINLKLRMQSEMEKTKGLLLKEERINRILVNMTAKNCSEEQMKEIRELITPPEANVLMRYQYSNQMLISGIMHADETLFIIELFLHYSKRDLKKK